MTGTTKRRRMPAGTEGYVDTILRRAYALQEAVEAYELHVRLRPVREDDDVPTTKPARPTTKARRVRR